MFSLLDSCRFVTKRVDFAIPENSRKTRPFPAINSQHSAFPHPQLFLLRIIILFILRRFSFSIASTGTDKMPKIISLTPRWLTRPSPGAEVFAAAPEQQHSSLRQQALVNESYLGPHKVLARRGTEVFVVVGSEIRWFNLRKLKHDGEIKQTESERKKQAYRVSRSHD